MAIDPHDPGTIPLPLERLQPDDDGYSASLAAERDDRPGPDDPFAPDPFADDPFSAALPPEPPVDLTATHVGRFALGLATEVEEEALTESHRAAQIRQAEREEEDRRMAEAEAADNPTQVALKGTIVRIRFSGDDFFIIAQLDVGLADPVTVKGNLAGANEWTDVELRGTWVNDPKWGRQFTFTEGAILLPSHEKGVLRFLEEHLPGIGLATSRRIVQEFGRGADGVLGVWTTLETCPEKLLTLPGITQERLDQILVAYREHHELREADVWLRGLGMGPKRTNTILGHLQERTRTVLEADPYVVMDYNGFGFKLADDLGKRIGVGNDHPGRARAAVIHVVKEAAEGEGHTYLPQREILARCAELGVPSDRVMEQIERLATGNKAQLVRYGEVGPERQVALMSLAAAEESIADQILSRMMTRRGEIGPVGKVGDSSPTPPAAVDPWQTILDEHDRKRGPEFDREKKTPALGLRAWKKRLAERAAQESQAEAQRLDPATGSLDPTSLLAALREQKL